MKNETQSLSVSSETIKTYEKVFGESGAATSRTDCQVFSFEAYSNPARQAPAKHSSISQLAAEWEQDADARAALGEGRKWVADTFYAEDGDTVRTLRLRKGWSQARLAQELSTSQSHIARIERGTENLTIETCRKLSRALEVDLNTLDQVLKRQEAIALTKQQ
jgi:ribosome-binding protein aMBF1 (putative translation factor)